MFSRKALIFIALCRMVYILPTSIADNLRSTSLCEEGWKQYDQHCYISQDEADWRTASYNCNIMGGNLPSIHSKKENDVFENFAILTAIKFWWTGLHDHEIDGIFMWDDGTDVDFTNWRLSEPYGEYYDSGNCAALSYANDHHGQWFVVPCTRKYAYLCQKKISTLITTSTEIDDGTVYILSTVADTLPFVGSSPCEEGWKHNDQHCYKYEGETVWRTASANCKSMGGNLPSIHSRKQNDILGLVADASGITYFWIGLHDHEIDGVFFWDDGTDIDYTNWRSGEPYGDYVHTGDCAAVSFTGNRIGQWYILPCNRHIHYLCQKKVGAYVSTETEMDEETAETIQTAEMDYETTHHFIMDYDTLAHHFIVDYETETTVFTRTEMDDSTVFTTFPHTIADNAAENGLTSCEEGWKQYDQYCFKLEEEHLDWNNASDKCISMGGHLASIHSKEQNDFFGGFAKEAEKTYWWIGLYNVDWSTFLWSDGTNVDYTNWRPREPHSMYHYSAYCVAKSFNIQYFGNWYTLDCRRKLPYLCQKNMSTSVIPNKEKVDSPVYMVPTTAVSSVPRKDLSPCEDGWKLYEQHCFKLEENSTDWRRASAKCKSMGGYLSSIHSKGQNDFFEEFTKETGKMMWWIGLNDLEMDNIYLWDDGTDVNYTNWRPTDPSQGNCVAQSFTYSSTHGMWYTMECDRSYEYMCRKKIERPVTTSTEFDVRTVTRSVITSTELDVRTVARSSITSAEMDDRTVPTAINIFKDHDEKEGFISVTTHAITLTIVIVFMALLGALLYYKRPWIEERRSKVGTVFFKNTDRVAEPSTELIIEPEERKL